VRTFADLGAHWTAAREASRRAERDAIRRAEREAAELAQRERERRRQLGAHDLFARAVGPVYRLRDRQLAEIDRPRPPPHPRQRELDEQAAMRESMSDVVTLETLLLTDDGLSFRRAGLGPDVVTRLRRGHWAMQGQVDLHGLTRDEAREAVARYVREAHRRGMRCIRVVHGKGHGSPGRQSVLKSKVQRWLAQRAEVIAFAQATGPQGGAGALIVLLAAHG
jgi:DNA-nicking Smr family endonuclease